MPDSEIIKQISEQQRQISTRLERMAVVLEELAAQKKDIEHLLVGHRDHREWLKNHETRLQKVEQVSKACNIGELSREVKALRQTPGNVALNFLYAIALMLIASVATWVAKG